MIELSDKSKLLLERVHRDLVCVIEIMEGGRWGADDCMTLWGEDWLRMSLMLVDLKAEIEKATIERREWIQSWK